MTAVHPVDVSRLEVADEFDLDLLEVSTNRLEQLREDG